MENKKAKRAPCKRVRENENLDSIESIESTSGLVQQHASGSCSPKIPRLTNSETCTAVQLPLHNPDDSCSSSHNNGRQERLRRRRDRDRLRRQNETEEQRSIRLNKQRVLYRRRLQSESPQEKTIRLERMRQRASTRNSVETEEQRSSRLTDACSRTAARVSEETEEERTSRLADLCQRANVRVSEETCNDRSHRLQVMRDLERVRRSSESSEAREVRLQALRIHNQSTRACTIPVLTPPLTGEEQRRIVQLSKDLEKFRSEIIVSPSNSCFSCHRLTYPQGGSYVTYETVEDLIAPLYSHPTTIPLPDVPEGECVWLCTRCQSILGKGKVPPYACINNIQVVKVPPVLSVLNTMEQRLISKVQAFMKLIVLPLGQRALAGQSINFPVDVSQVCNALPRPIDESGVILVQSSSSTSASTSTADGGEGSPSTVPSSSSITTHSCKGYVVRKPKIMRALHWLKTSNILYADIHLEDGNITCDDNDNNNDEDDDENNDDNDDNTTTNAEDEQQQQQQHEGTVNGPPQLESSVVRTDFNMPNTEAIDIIRNGDFNYPVYRLPRVEGQPISLFTDAKAEEMAFPCLFPNGVNGFLTARDPAISITDYIQIRLLNADSRWASHIPYLLWSCNLLEQHRLRDAVCIAMRIRSSSGGRRPRNHLDQAQLQEHDQQALTAGDLLSDTSSENPDLSENCFGFMRNIRGSAAYWKRAKLDLFAMFRTLGPPTFFLTLSADDMNWTDLLYILANRDGMDLTEQQAKDLPATQRKRLLCSYPVDCCSTLFSPIQFVYEIYSKWRW